MKLTRAACTVVLVALLAGCSDPEPNGPSTTTTSTQAPEPELHWLWVNRTLSVSGTNAGANAEGFQAAPGNANCVAFQHIGEAGLTSLLVTVEGDNPPTVAAWDLIANFPFPRQPENLTRKTTGLLPLTLDVPVMDVEGQDDMRIWVETARSEPGSTAVQNSASLSIRLGAWTPEAFNITDGVTSCST